MTSIHGSGQRAVATAVLCVAMMGAGACGGSSASPGPDVSDAAGDAVVDRGPSPGEDAPAPADAAADQSHPASDGGAPDTPAGADAKADASTTPPGGVPVFVAVGYDMSAASAPRVATSCDGRVWKNQPIALPAGTWTDAETNGLRGLGWGGGRFVAVGGGTGEGSINTRRLYVSTDGVNWVHEDQSYECSSGSSCTAASICTSCQWMGDATWLDDGTALGLWVMAGGNGQRRYSTNGGVSWQKLSTGNVGQYRRLASEGAHGAATADRGLATIELAAGQNPPVAFTDAPITGITEPSVAVGRGTPVAVWWDTACYTFTLGSWRACTLPRTPTAITSVVFDGGSFWVLGRDPAYTSADGVTFTQPGSTAGSDFRQIRFGGGVYVEPGIRRWSTDAVRWQNMTTPPTFTVTDVEVGVLPSCP